MGRDPAEVVVWSVTGKSSCNICELLKTSNELAVVAQSF